MRITIATLMLLIICSSLGATGDWVRTGPVTGTVVDIVPDRRNPSLWYAIHGNNDYTGRLYRSTDNGESWTPTRLDQIASIVVSPSNSEVFVLSDVQQDLTRQLWVSTDLGNTFHLQSSRAPSHIFAHPQDPSTLVGIPNTLPGNLVFSSNAGRDWVPITSLPYKPGKEYSISYPGCRFQDYEFSDVLISPIDGKTIYASAELFFRCGNYDNDERSVTFRSNNLGRTWTVEELRRNNFSYDPAFPDRAFSFNLDDSSSTIRMLTKKGWHLLSHQPILAITSVPGHEQELYAYTLDYNYRGLPLHLRSRDLGKTWQRITLGPANGVRVLVGRQEPTETFLGGTIGGGLYSLDAKGFWKPQQRGFRETSLIDVAGGPPSPILYVISRTTSGNESYLYRSTNNGRRWQNITDRLPFSNAAALGLWGLISNPKNAQHVIVQVGRKMAVSFNSGETWNILKQNSILDNTYFHPVRQNEVYFTTWRRLFKSTDGGNTVKELPLVLPNAYAFTDIEIDRDTDDIYLGSDRGMYISTDHGRSMRPIGPEQHRNCNNCWVSSIVQLSGRGKFLIAAASGIYKTIDHGNTWQHLSTFSQYYSKLYPTDPEGNHIFSIRDFLVESNDGGVTWKNISGEVDPLLPRTYDLGISAITNPFHLPWFVSTRLGLYQTN